MSDCRPGVQEAKRMAKWPLVWHCYKPLMLVRPNISQDLPAEVLAEPRLARCDRISFPNHRGLSSYTLLRNEASHDEAPENSGHRLPVCRLVYLHRLWRQERSASRSAATNECTIRRG